MLMKLTELVQMKHHVCRRQQVEKIIQWERTHVEDLELQECKHIMRREIGSRLYQHSHKICEGKHL